MKSEQEIRLFEKAILQLNVIIVDFVELSKKKPDGPANKFKLHLVNSILETLNAIIDEANKPFSDFSIFSEDDLPSNSDILVILNQYRKCSKDFTLQNKDGSYWIVKGKRSNIEIDFRYLFGI